MKDTIRDLARRVIPADVRRSLRQKRSAIRAPTMGEGVGSGLRFDPGPSNPDYGRGDNELPVQRALAEIVRPGDVVFDIGANVGFFSIICARLTGPSGRVFAFEPVAANAELIRRNAGLNEFGNISVVEQAVSDRTGTGELVLAEYSGGAALSTTTPPPDAAGSIEVELITIDAAVDDGHIPPPDVVKIDVEGVEIEVLRGMTDTMRRDRPIIVCEIDDGTRAGYDRKHRECVEYLESLDYSITPLPDSYVGGTWLVGHFVARPAPDDPHPR